MQQPITLPLTSHITDVRLRIPKHGWGRTYYVCQPALAQRMFR